VRVRHSLDCDHKTENRNTGELVTDALLVNPRLRQTGWLRMKIQIEKSSYENQTKKDRPTRTLRP
jgi:membrane protein involved in colicin uptake